MKRKPIIRDWRGFEQETCLLIVAGLAVLLLSIELFLRATHNS